MGTKRRKKNEGEIMIYYALHLRNQQKIKCIKSRAKTTGCNRPALFAFRACKLKKNRAIQTCLEIVVRISYGARHRCSPSNHIWDNGIVLRKKETIRNAEKKVIETTCWHYMNMNLNFTNQQLQTVTVAPTIDIIDNMRIMKIH